MAAPKGNKNAVGNRGGGRLGYQYEKDQLKKLQRLVNLYLAKAEAIEKGKLTDKELDKFRILQPLALKAMDKLHANKQHIEHEGEMTSKIISVDE